MNHLELLSLNNDANKMDIIEKEIVFSKDDLIKEVDFIKVEGKFFLRLLKQSKFYSQNQDRGKIDELTSNLEQFLEKEPEVLKKDLTNHSELGQLGENGEATFEQNWLDLKKGFSDLKMRAMDLLGNFFTIKFQ